MSKMTDEERANLSEKLNEDLEKFVQEKIASSKNRPVLDYESKTVDEIAEELKQHPAFMTEFDESKPLTPAMEALQALKYELQSNDDNAISYKEDGNKNFERNKFRWAIDNYTAGINCQPVDKLLNAVLFTNRAAAQFRIENFRSSLKDCMIARKFKPDHMKAILRGVQCCMKMEKYEEAVKWCDEGLSICPTDSKLLEFRSKADQSVRQKERDRRKKMAAEKKELVEKMKILNAIQDRKIKVAPPPNKKCLDENPALAILECDNQNDAKITLAEDGLLYWPVMFLYPEYGTNDFVRSFCEATRFDEQLDVIFSHETPVWDTENKYKPENIEIYFMEKRNDADRMHRIDNSSTLLHVMQNRRFTVYGGTQAFFVVVKDSDSRQRFLTNYTS